MPTPDQLTQQLLMRQPTKPIGAPIPLPTEDTTPPTPAKSAFESGTDFVLGLLGLGPETKANLTGQLLMAGLPIAGGLKGIPGTYSRLNRAAEEMPDKLTAAAAKNYLMQRAGKEEMGYRSALSTLENKNPMEKVNKPELLDHLKQNPLDVEVKELGTPKPTLHPESGNYIDTNPTRYDTYTLPGGQNYRETLIKLPTKFNRQPLDGTLSASELTRQAEDYLQERNAAGVFQSNHWEDPNILVHVRHNERHLPDVPFNPEQQAEYNDAIAAGGDDLNKALRMRQAQAPKGRFLEEVQSDWHEQGRDRGYVDAKAIEQASKEHEQAIRMFDSEIENLRNALRQTGGFPRVAEVEPWAVMDAARYANEFKNIPEVKEALYNAQDAHGLLTNATNKINDLTSSGKVPDAPFKTSWPDLALKQQLLDVADRPDLEWLGWTPGEVQNKRYDLSQVASEIRYNPETGHFYALDPHGNVAVDRDNIKPQELQDMIGKDATTRLMQTPPISVDPAEVWGVDDTIEDMGDPETTGYHRLSGEQLQVGGEGMNKFYDERLPNTMNKLLKPFGGKVEQAAITQPRKPLSIRAEVASTGDHYSGQVIDPDSEARVIANTWPLFPRQPGAIPAAREAADELANQIYASAPNKTIQAWIARLSPEMKERIKKEGLPLLMALLARQGLTVANGSDSDQPVEVGH